MTAAYQPNAYQKNAYQADSGVSRGAFQPNAFQFTAFQEDASAVVPAFDGCAFQFNAFQSAPCPVPPPPIPIYDGHDGGKRHRKTLKKLQDLEDARIQALKVSAENRKMLIRHALDPQAKAEYEAKIQAGKVNPVEAKVIVAEVKAIDQKIDKLEKLAKNLELKSIITSELARIHEARMVQEKEIARQIRQADDELALMLMM